MSTHSEDMDISDLEAQHVKAEEDITMGGLDNALPYTSVTAEQAEFQHMMDDTSMAHTSRIRTPGVRPGTAGKPRKDVSQLSNNKHTKRARERISKLTGNDLELHKAKARDASAISTSKKCLKASERYQNASEEDKLRMIEDDKRMVTYRRILRGMHANNTALNLSMITDGSDFVELKLGEPDLPDGENGWNDFTEAELEDDPQYQAYLASVEKEEFQFNATSLPNSPLMGLDAGIAAFREQGRRIKMTMFLHTRAYWQSGIFSLLRKIKHFGWHRIPGVPWCAIDTCKHPEFSMMWGVPTINRETGQLINRGDIVFDKMAKTYRANRVPPHEYFTLKERAVWRNLAAWKLISDSGWIEYPGPSDWWPEDYDYVRHGWVPDDNPEKAEAAFLLMTDGFNAEEVPIEFKHFKITGRKLTTK